MSSSDQNPAMTPAPPDSSAAVLLPAALGAVAVIAWLGAVALRLTYPYELEWMEGAMIDHVARILQGLPLYTAPGIDFIPVIYAPMYFYLTALVSLVTGPGFLAARIVAVAGTVALFAGVWILVRRETGNHLWGTTAAGLLAAGYQMTGFWYDLARVDTLFLAFMVWAVYVVRHHRGGAAGTVCGILMALAFLTKQTAAVMALPILLYLALFDRKTMVWTAGTAGVLGGGAVLLLDRLYNGWFSYWAFTLPGRHPTYQSVYLAFWTNDLLPAVPVVIILVAGYFGRQFRSGFTPSGFLWLLVSIGFVGASLMARLHSGGWINGLIPALVALAMVGCLGADAAVRFLLHRHNSLARAGVWMVVAALSLQFALLAYNPLDAVPSAADRKAGNRLITELAAIDGDILVPFHGWYAAMAGKSPSFHQMALNDLRKGDSVRYRAFERELKEALTSGRYAAVVTDRPWFDPTLRQSYIAEKIMFPSDSVLLPVTGYAVRPETLWRRKDAARDPSAPAP